jgi:hypothetical protein
MCETPEFVELLEHLDDYIRALHQSIRARRPALASLAYVRMIGIDRHARARKFHR